MVEVRRSERGDGKGAKHKQKQTHCHATSAVPSLIAQNLSAASVVLGMTVQDNRTGLVISLVRRSCGYCLGIRMRGVASAGRESLLIELQF